MENPGLIPVKRPSRKRILEIAVSTPASLFAAIAGGADRVELCAALSAGGLTPDQAWLEFAQQQPLPIVMMVRPRPGNFIFSRQELDIMVRSIKVAGKAGLQGIAAGVLTLKNRVDRDAISRLREAAGDMDFTFHRAFDASPEPLDDLDLLVELRVDRILSGGGQGAAGKDGLMQFVHRAAGRITVVAAGSLRPDTIGDLLSIEGLNEFHSAAAHKTPTDYPGEYLPDPEASAAIVTAMRKLLDQ